MPSITVPTRTGYTFGGYYTSTGGSGTQYYIASGASARSYTLTSSTTLYAKWTANTYTLTYNNQSGSGCTSQTGTYGSTWGTLCTPTYSGYTFNGWYTSTGGSGTQVTSSTTVSGNLTVYAKWTSSCSGKILADGNCWYMVSGSWTYANAQSHCPSGYSVATKSQLDTLVGKYSGGGLYTALGLSSTSGFWSTTLSSTVAYFLYVTSSDAYVTIDYQSNTRGVACIK